MIFVSQILFLAISAIHLTAPVNGDFRLIPEFNEDPIFEGQEDYSDHVSGRQVGKQRQLIRKKEPAHEYTYLVEEMSLLCITVKDKKVRNGSNVWFRKCKKGNPRQLWRFSSEYEDGTWHTKANDKKCVQAQPKHRYGSRLRMFDCDANVPGQIFSQSGGTIDHVSSGLMAYTRREMKKGGAKNGDYLVLVRDGWSIDSIDDYYYISERVNET